MSNPFRNARLLFDQYKRDSARAYLARVGREHLSQFPQMCCYSFDDIAVEINIDGQADRYALEKLLEVVKAEIKGRTVLDVGANIGNHALAFSEIAARVFSFEPHPVTYQLLSLNIRNQKNITAVNSGASDTAAQLRAISPVNNRGATSISERPIVAGEEAWVFNVEPLDSRNDINETDVAMIKMDVEGHEEFALRGLEKCIRRNKPLIVVEQNTSAIANNTSATFELLKSFGYSTFYSIDIDIQWRTSQRLPLILRRLSRIIESLIFGPANFDACLTTVNRLEHRDYPMLIASFASLSSARDHGIV